MCYLGAVVSGILYCLSFPGYSFDYLAWFALIPLLFSIYREKVDYKKGIICFFVFGLISFLGGLWWLRHVTFGGYLCLAFCCAFYPVVWGLILIRYRDKVSFTFLAPLAFTALEYIKTHLFTGLPWGLLGSTQFENVFLIQISAVTGVYGVSFLLVLVNAALVETTWLVRKKTEGLTKYFPLAASILLVVLSCYYGKITIESRIQEMESGSELKVSLVQGNIAPTLDWNPAYSKLKFLKYEELTFKLKEEKPQLIIWPESAVDFEIRYHDEVRQNISEIAKEMDAFMVIGSNDIKFKERKRYYNSAFFISPKGEILGSYDKIHLVPFGEYIPYINIFPFLKSVIPIPEDYSPGEEFTIFSLKQKKGSHFFGILICFEDTFPNLARKFVYQGANFLVNITNDGWFGRSSAAHQQEALAVFRAVENNVYFLRGTSTGVSSVINPYGKIISTVKDSQGNETWVSGVTTERIFLPLERSVTFYTVWGDLFSILCVIVLSFLMVFKSSFWQKEDV